MGERSIQHAVIVRLAQSSERGSIWLPEGRVDSDPAADTEVSLSSKKPRTQQ